MAGSVSGRGGAEAAEPAAPLRVGNMEVQIARWYNGKQSAISLQCEGSDPSLLTIGVPALNYFGELVPTTGSASERIFVVTFLPDRNSAAYRTHRQEWETAVRDGRHEFGRPGMKAPLVLTVGSAPGKADLVGLDAFRTRMDEHVATNGWLSLSFRAIGTAGDRAVPEADFRQMMNYLSRKRYSWDAWIGGVSQVYKYQKERDAARVSAEAVSPSKIKIELECGTDAKVYDQPLTIQVDFEPQWRDYQYDVEVLDGDGNRIPALRQANLGPPLYIPVPPVRGTYYVQVTDPRGDDPVVVDGTERTVRDPATGLEATLCRWYDGRKAAVSFRFDDSYGTNINKAVPWLREYGLKGTFQINPGNDEYQRHRAAWEACAAQGDQEFGNHTLHHHGALSDEEVELEIGETCRVIWGLFPNKSKLVSLITGGGSVWRFSQPFRYYADKYSVFAPHPQFALSVGDKDAENYRGLLDRAIAAGGWLATSYHSIALPWMSDETFRSVLESTKARAAEIWPAGLADAHKYEQERNTSGLALRSGPGEALTLAVTCGTDRELYDQPLTIELALPDGWTADKVQVRDAQGKAIATRAALGQPQAGVVYVRGGDGANIQTRVDTEPGRPVVRFDVPPTNGEYTISR